MAFKIEIEMNRLLQKAAKITVIRKRYETHLLLTIQKNTYYLIKWYKMLNIQMNDVLF